MKARGGRRGAAASGERPSLALALRPFGRRFAWAGAYFAALFLLGAAAYVAIEGWSWFDALYMAVTTVTSVGFMEVYPLSNAGRAFTMVLIALGVTGLGIWWGLITALIVELDLGGLLRRRRMMRKIGGLADHFIVCGVGRVGRVCVEEIAESGKPFVVVERAAERAATLLARYPTTLVVEGDATREQTLLDAGVERARGLAACLTSDADNLLLCLTARELRPELTIVARAGEEESLDKLRRAGADHVISPSVTGGVRIASTLLRPQVVSFLDVATRGSDIDLRLEEAEIPASSRLAGTTLAEARIPQRTGLVVIAVRPRAGNGQPVYNPGPETRLSPGDV